MKKSDWKKLDKILAVAVELEPAQYDSFIREACDGDADLYGEAEKMLAAIRQADADNYLDQDAFSVGATVLAEQDKIGTEQIGNYKIIREIGRGGMGRVFLATREDFHQKVAIKIIKRGMDTDEIVRRFERERKVLAALNHPFIARLIDGGTTEDGLPYLVMEYVEGEPVTEFCDRKKLGIEERLELFRKICEAVAFAHQNLIVHRDIKPSNIMIDNGGQPKLLDFGIAKLLTESGNTQTLTEAGLRMMTPEYASPEQIRGEKITTASDIYSLGVLLYELLSGHRPFRLKNRTSREVLKIISEEHPRSPSTAALTIEEIYDKQETKQRLSPETVADLRSEKPQRLSRRLLGDLDNIVLKSLYKEPPRRYHTVEQFSEDLRRHLEGLPVSARPATFGYHISKFVNRNRTAVAFATVALLAILTGLSVSIWQAVVARQERAKAETRFKDVRKLANTLLTNFDEKVKDLPGAHPLRVELARISSEYLNGLAQEENTPDLLKDLAMAYARLGDEFAANLDNIDEAKTSLASAVEIAHQAVVLAPDDLEAKSVAAWCLEKYNEYFTTDDYELALEYALERVRLREEILVAKPNERKAYSEASTAYWACGSVLSGLDRQTEAKDCFRRAAEVRERQIRFLQETGTTTDDRVSLASAFLTLGILQARDLGDKQNGMENMRRAVEIAVAVAAENPDHKFALMEAVESQLELANLVRESGNYRGALEVYREGLKTSRDYNARFHEAWGFDREIWFLFNSATCLNKIGETEAALKNVREVFRVLRNYAEPDIESLHMLYRNAETFYAGGRFFAMTGKFDEALAAYREAETFWNKALAAETDKTKPRNRIAELYLAIGDLSVDCKPDVLSFSSCKPESMNIAKKDRKRIEEASRWYKKALNILDLSEKNTKDENLRAANEKLAICLEKLN